MNYIVAITNNIHPGGHATTLQVFNCANPDDNGVSKGYEQAYYTAKAWARNESFDWTQMEILNTKKNPGPFFIAAITKVEPKINKSSYSRPRFKLPNYENSKS